MSTNVNVYRQDGSYAAGTSDSIVNSTPGYARLGNYNGQGCACAPIMQVPSMAVQAVPVWGTSGYNCGTSCDVACCNQGSGYMAIDCAYGNNCGVMVARNCAGNIDSMAVNQMVGMPQSAAVAHHAAHSASAAHNAAAHSAKAAHSAHVNRSSARSPRTRVRRSAARSPHRAHVRRSASRVPARAYCNRR